MSKTKKNSRSDALEDILIEGEEVLWQGKSNASRFEYLNNLFPRLKGQDDIGCLSGIAMLLGVACGGGTAGALLVLLKSVIPDTISIWLQNLFLIPLAIVSFLGGSIFFTLLFAYSIYYLSKFFPRLIVRFKETSVIRYAITNKRIIVLTNSLLYDFLHHDVVNGVVIEDSEKGASMTWHSVESEESAIQPFLGLSEFDVTHLIDLVRKQETFELTIEDNRQKKQD